MVPDLEHLQPTVAASISRAISPGFACRPSLDFSKTGLSSTITSNLPFPDGIIMTAASGHRFLSSAARPTARGS